MIDKSVVSVSSVHSSNASKAIYTFGNLWRKSQKIVPLSEGDPVVQGQIAPTNVDHKRPSILTEGSEENRRAV